MNSLVQRQVKGETLSEDHYIFIATCTLRLMHIVLPAGAESYMLEPKEKQMALIADIPFRIISARWP